MAQPSKEGSGTALNLVVVDADKERERVMMRGAWRVGTQPSHASSCVGSTACPTAAVMEVMWRPNTARDRLCGVGGALLCLACAFGGARLAGSGGREPTESVW